MSIHEDRIEGYDQPVHIDLKHLTIELLGTGCPDADRESCMMVCKDNRRIRVEVGVQYMTGATVDDATPLRRFLRINRIVSQEELTQV